MTKHSSKTGLLIVLIILFLIGLGGGYYYYNKSKTSDAINTTSSNVASTSSSFRPSSSSFTPSSSSSSSFDNSPVVTAIPLNTKMYYGTHLSSVTTKQTGKKYLSFDSSGAVVQKTYGSSTAPIIIIQKPIYAVTDTANTYVLSFISPLFTNAINLTRGKIGIQVWINGTLHYEKYQYTDVSNHPTSGYIYSNDTYPWALFTNQSPTDVTSSSTGVVENYY